MIEAAEPEIAYHLLPALYFFAIPIIANLVLFWVRNIFSLKVYLLSASAVIAVCLLFNFIVGGITLYSCGQLCGAGTATWPLVLLSIVISIAYYFKINKWYLTLPYYGAIFLVNLLILKGFGGWVS